MALSFSKGAACVLALLGSVQLGVLPSSKFDGSPSPQARFGQKEMLAKFPTANQQSTLFVCWKIPGWTACFQNKVRAAKETQKL